MPDPTTSTLEDRALALLTHLTWDEPPDDGREILRGYLGYPNWSRRGEYETILAALQETDATARAEEREAAGLPDPATMPEGVKALPPKLREAWLAGEILWSGEKLRDRPPLVKTKPGMSVSDLMTGRCPHCGKWPRDRQTAEDPIAARAAEEGE